LIDTAPTILRINYDPANIRGTLTNEGIGDAAIWDRIVQSALQLGSDYLLGEHSLELSWQGVLSLIREYGRLQKTLNFRFKPEGEAKERIDTFVRQYRDAQAAKGTLTYALTEDEVRNFLKAAGFVKRELHWFQMRDLRRLLALENGANFSVPGAGKTTVALALNLLTKKPGQHFLVVSPKAAFPAWREVVNENMTPDSPDGNAEEFTILSGTGASIQKALDSGATRFVINYDLLISHPDIIQAHLASHPTQLLLDESHRMKAGFRSQRGALLLSLAALPIRRDILTGTPMPQSESDMSSQLNFLWPGLGYGEEIAAGRPPRDVLGNLYVRTTKDELGLTPPNRKFTKVPMAEGQLALYAIIKDEALRELSKFGTAKGPDLFKAKRSVMRLLQLSSNPILALNALTRDTPGFNSGIAERVLAEGPSTKMRAVDERVRELFSKQRKTVVWTIFTDTIFQMEGLLADLNPVSLYGAIPSGDPSDLETREGRIRRFHVDPNCAVLVANPAAAGEGISLHHVCHDALYLDRTYVTTHYLQSIDRIHRLGLPKDIETNIEIFQTMTAPGLGCIDHSVSRRLAKKIRELQKLLDDRDLHRIALDEENADEPIDYDISEQDIFDLIEELEGNAEYDENDPLEAA
jgi:SNF2 family DNA or RNA helicase